MTFIKNKKSWLLLLPVWLQETPAHFWPCQTKLTLNALELLHVVITETLCKSRAQQFPEVVYSHCVVNAYQASKSDAT